jgi:leader peptidase (prepilin peptidase) / N-methyltransferase
MPEGAAHIGAGVFALVAFGAALLGAGLAASFGARLGRQASVAMAVAVAVVAAVAAPSPHPPAYSAWSALMLTGLVALGTVDWDSRTVPDALSMPMIAAGLMHAATLPGALVPFAAGVAALLALFLAASRLAPVWLARGFGGGDALLLAGAAAWLGPTMLLDQVLLTGFLLIPQLIGRLVPRPARAPVGPKSEPPGVALAPAHGLAQLMLWFGGPIF